MKEKARGARDLRNLVAGVEVVVGACGVERKRRPGAVQDELVGSGGAQRLTESDSKSERQRGTRGSPELIAGVGSVCGGVGLIEGSLVAE